MVFGTHLWCDRVRWRLDAGSPTALHRVGRCGWLAWVTYAGLGLFVLGLGQYVIVLYRFDWRQLAGGAGDLWVLGGALAISSRAGES
jgi:hypothetical protein